MKRKINKKKLWIQAAVVLLLAVGAVAAFIRSEAKPMSKDELKIATADLRSFSAAGAQLSVQFLDGQTTETFLKTQSSLLEDKVADLKKQLDSADPEKGFELKHWEARSLARQTDESLKRLAESAQTASGAKDELKNLFSKLKELEDSLKE
jgi:hypothetical protein